ncbi:ATP-binding cassette domain-containing protein [Nocardioides sp. BP30]|uniref:ATP-binding cassette domain-containing protein n=1 Tax=Nocardioides sp. BP30 TaxID=3036374 RepID=UPI0024691F99|nr:ATP-binding cassette domain-containing protein [Nocardioides sp. BP30]WGL52160.1 ATP-binding cassette domain-containing protein [Nocardioides sp. BP30]
MSADDVLTLAGLEVRRGGRVVVDDVSFSVRRGEVVAVLGPNGAGKSTLLEAIGGVLPARGRRRVEGRVATVLQTPGLASRSVRANVDLAQAWFGVPRAERRQRTIDALRRMRADHLAGRPAAALSGGERRRVHLARGVAVGADLLLLDEPFAGLDPETQRALVADTASTLREAAGAVVVVLHDRADAWALADRVLIVMAGRIVADADPESLMQAPPTPEVARFLGFDGALDLDETLVLTRPAHVRLDPDGEIEATVGRVTRLEDGARIELVTPHGTVFALHPTSTVAEGSATRFSLLGGVRFPR